MNQDDRNQKPPKAGNLPVRTQTTQRSDLQLVASVSIGSDTDNLEEIHKRSGLMRLPKELNQHGLPFIEAHFNDYNGDPSQRWYVEYHAWDEQRGALRRKRIYKIVGKTIEQRQNDCRALVNAINRQLRQGWILTAKPGDIVEQPKEEPITARSSLTTALTYALRSKSLHIRKSSRQDYEVVLRVFLEWAKGRKLDKVPVGGFGAPRAAQALDEMQRDRRVSNSTRNNWKTKLSTFFNFLKNREIIQVNPFAKVAKLREEVGRNHAFPAWAIPKLKAGLIEENPELWLFCLFIYGTFTRPHELVSSKVEQIDWTAKRFHIPAAISKNRESASVTIPAQLYDYLLELGINNRPGSAYLFSFAKDWTTPWGTNYANRAHRRVVDRVLADPRYTLYSWKHTGAAALYESSKDVMLVKLQCRHGNVTITERYLKSLGLSASSKIQDYYRPI